VGTAIEFDRRCGVLAYRVPRGPGGSFRKSTSARQEIGARGTGRWQIGRLKLHFDETRMTLKEQVCDAAAHGGDGGSHQELLYD
jgi:hypothetical protein